MSSEIKIIQEIQTDVVVKYSNGEVVLPAVVIESLPQAVKSIVIAKTTPCIVDYNQDELENKITTLISGMFQDAGQVIDGKDLATFSYRLMRELYNMKFLHFGELEIAFSNGLRGLYGQNFGINLLSVLRWIDGYKNSEEHKQYAFEVSKMIGAKTEPTEEEKEQIAKKLALKTLEDHRSGKDISCQSVTVYDYLDDIGLIVFSREQKFDFYNRAYESIKAQLAFKASKTDNRTERNELKKQIINVGKLQNKEELTGAEKINLLLKNEAKRLALNSFFDDLIEFEQPLFTT